MAKKSGNEQFRLIPEDSELVNFEYYVWRNPRKLPDKLRMRKFHPHPSVRKHVWFVEKKLPSPKV